MASSLKSGRVLNEDDTELYDIAQRLAFDHFQLKRFASLLLKSSGCKKSGDAFLGGLDVHEYTTVPSRAHALLIYWIKGAPGPPFHRYGGQLMDVLSRTDRNDINRDFYDYLIGTGQESSANLPDGPNLPPSAGIPPLESSSGMEKPLPARAPRTSPSAAGKERMFLDAAMIVIAGRSTDLHMTMPKRKKNFLEFCRQYNLKDITGTTTGDGGLHGSVDDLQRMCTFLKKCKVSVQLLLSFSQGEPGISNKDTKDKLTWFFSLPRHGFVLYFSGHGNRCGDWVLDEGSTITFEDVYQLFVSRQCPPEVGDRAQQKLLIIADCCFSGQWIHQLEAKQRQRGASQDAQLIFIQAACGSTETSSDLETGGVFTRIYTETRLHCIKDVFGPLSEEEKAKEKDYITRIGDYAPDASIQGDKCAQVVDIGSGLAMTKSWTAMMKHIPTLTSADKDRRESRTTQQVSAKAVVKVAGAMPDLRRCVLLAVELGCSRLDLMKLNKFEDMITAKGILEKWLGREGTNATGQRLYDALVNIELKMIADEYERLLLH